MASGFQDGKTTPGGEALPEQEEVRWRDNDKARPWKVPRPRLSLRHFRKSYGVNVVAREVIIPTQEAQMGCVPG